MPSEKLLFLDAVAERPEALVTTAAELVVILQLGLSAGGRADHLAIDHTRR